jgi:transcription initiation factor TFIIIB Brf1 subunit/transcription initiation factor TFIIB
MADEEKCPVCGSKTFRTRITTGDRICTKYGHVWEIHAKSEEKKL